MFPDKERTQRFCSAVAHVSSASADSKPGRMLGGTLQLNETLQKGMMTSEQRLHWLKSLEDNMHWPRVYMA